ncbi:hypothetical protein E2C01_102663 [Portunus trituberculatus]|uniref:Uncharacterized protein n=1 Tax=Portunus trituberculatus TaxID=210409 RepID=A0A5B7K8U2_PORTR|nr:hypothetical protein [Portunus trituberculatus]
MGQNYGYVRECSGVRRQRVIVLAGAGSLHGTPYYSRRAVSTLQMVLAKGVGLRRDSVDITGQREGGGVGFGVGKGLEG